MIPIRQATLTTVVMHLPSTSHEGSVDSLWGGPDATDKDIQKSWADFVEELVQSDAQVPDVLRRTIDDHFRNGPIEGNDEYKPDHPIRTHLIAKE